MPGIKKAGSVRAVDFIKDAPPETKTALLGILAEDSNSPAFTAVLYFRDIEVSAARAVLDVITSEVKEREGPSPQQKGADKRKKKAAEATLTESGPDTKDAPSTTPKKGGK